MPTPPDVEHLVEAWLDAQHRPLTQQAYRPVIEEWLTWIAAQGVNPLDATRQHGDQWRHHLESTPTRSGRPAAKRTVARKLATVSSWYSYLEDVEALPRSPFARVGRPKVQRRYGETAALTQEEAAALLAAAEAAGPRTHVAVGILLETAIRADELLTLDVSGIRVRQTLLTIRVVRKGGEADILPLPERLAHDVHELRGDRREGPLLAIPPDGPWTYAKLNHAIAAAGRAAGITERVTPHVCRATWATLAIEHGVSLATVQDVMGHASADTTRIYDRGRDNIRRKAGAVEKVSRLVRGLPSGDAP